MVLVDSNILLDVLTNDPTWHDWSSRQLAECAAAEGIAINPIIFAEVAPQFDTQDQAQNWLQAFPLELLELPYDAAFSAGKAHALYRRSGGDKRAPMPDFYIGAHAAVASLKLLTRDIRRYPTYFPHLQLICPPAA